ncbi:MAG: hypothetical protein J6Q89_04940 [Clostridia bacterium]|nr:hypothetical protein [Clostridia bacterium]
MNRARKKRYKRGMLKRLAQESFVLSATRRLSSRFVRFFESGFASPLLASYKKVDEFAREKISDPIEKRIGIRKNFAMPTRNAIASFIARSPIMKTFNQLRTSFLNTSMRSVGVFLLTFGIYAAAIFALKSYVSVTLGTPASINDISFSAVTALIGIILMLFGDKTILNTLGNGRIVGQLLLKCLGVNDSSVDKYASATPITTAGVSFLLGSIFGISTLFYTPASVMFFIAVLLVCIAILHIPEFGILLSAAIFSFVSIYTVAFVVSVTFISFLIKCIRLKRNFGFGTADAVVLMLFAVTCVACVTTQGNVTHRELYVICFTSVYFLAKNLLCSEKLVYQTLNALCVGLTAVKALYILGDFTTLIPHDELRNGPFWLTKQTLDGSMLAMAASVLLPFALSSLTSADKRRPKRMFLVFAIVCAVLVDSPLFYVMLFASVFVFAATMYKAPVGATLGAVLVIPPVAVLASDYTASSAFGFGVKTVYDTESMSLVQEKFANFWSGIYRFGGVVAVCLFVIAMLLILQRIFGTIRDNAETKGSHIGGTVAASTIIALCCSFIFNPFDDLRMLMVMWFVIGFGSAISKIVSFSKYSE